MNSTAPSARPPGSHRRRRPPRSIGPPAPANRSYSSARCGFSRPDAASVDSRRGRHRRRSRHARAVPPAADRPLAARPSRRALLELDGTLVSVDLSGFTALSERLAAKGRAGSEELILVISGVFEGLIGIADRHGGDVLKFRGDALLILFEGDGHERARLPGGVGHAVVHRARRQHDELGRPRLAPHVDRRLHGHRPRLPRRGHAPRAHGHRARDDRDVPARGRVAGGRGPRQRRSTAEALDPALARRAARGGHACSCSNRPRTTIRPGRPGTRRGRRPRALRPEGAPCAARVRARRGRAPPGHRGLPQVRRDRRRDRRARAQPAALEQLQRSRPS